MLRSIPMRTILMRSIRIMLHHAMISYRCAASGVMRRFFKTLPGALCARAGLDKPLDNGSGSRSRGQRRT
jgi:hypothetical protein